MEDKIKMLRKVDELTRQNHYLIAYNQAVKFSFITLFRLIWNTYKIQRLLRNCK